ncbi:hypothetical protein GVAV_000732 [Gurleya vavrai]
MNFITSIFLILFFNEFKLSKVNLRYQPLVEHCKKLVYKALNQKQVINSTGLNKQAAIVFQYQNESIKNEYSMFNYVDLDKFRPLIIEHLIKDFKIDPNSIIESIHEESENEKNPIFKYKFKIPIVYEKIKYNFCVFFYYTLIEKNEEQNKKMRSYFELIKKQSF